MRIGLTESDEGRTNEGFPGCSQDSRDSSVPEMETLNGNQLPASPPEDSLRMENRPGEDPAVPLPWSEVFGLDGDLRITIFNEDVARADENSDGDQQEPAGASATVLNEHGVEGYIGDEVEPMTDNINDNVNAHTYCSISVVHESNAGKKQRLSSISDDEQNGPIRKHARIASKSSDISTLPTNTVRSVLKLPGILKFPIPRLLEEHTWTVDIHGNFKLGTSGFSYAGHSTDGKMNGAGKLFLGESGEFFEGNWVMNRLMDLQSAQLMCISENLTATIIKRQNDHLLSIYERNFIARIFLNDTEELDFTAAIPSLKSKFFANLHILEVVMDDTKEKIDNSLDNFESQLFIAIGEDADPKVRGNTVYLLGSYLENIDPDWKEVLIDLNMPENVRIAALDVIDCHTQCSSGLFTHPDQVVELVRDLEGIMAKVYSHGVDRHVRMVAEKCPDHFPNLSANILVLPSLKNLYVTGEDMGVFDHLASLPCFGLYKPFFDNLVHKFCSAISSIDELPSKVIPVMPPTYGFLFKSFWEIISEIIKKVGGIESKDMLKYESGEWKLKEAIIWPERDRNDSKTQRVNFFKPSEEKHSVYLKSLWIQYQFLFKLMNDFSPESYAVNKNYSYNFKVFDPDLLVGQEESSEGGLTTRLESLTPDRCVWLVLLDHTIHEVFKNDPKYPTLLKPYTALLLGQISFIEQSPTDNHEAFRMLMHSIVKFITLTAPYFRDASEQAGIDVKIVVQQVWTFSSASQEMDNDPFTSSSFRDLVAEYNRYLSLRLSINGGASSGYFSPKIADLMQTVMLIIATSVKKRVPIPVLVGYLRSLNDFLDDFKNIDFLAMWYVKTHCPGTTVLVDNNLSESANRSYLVTDIEKYVRTVRTVPHHYIILVVSQLLTLIETSLNKQWHSQDEDLQVAQLKCTGLLLDAIRRSFMYLKEQPDYIEFETFKNESVGLFLHLVDRCTDFMALKESSEKVAESFWYIRKMDEIGIKQAQKMFESANKVSMLASERLSRCYDLYLSCYNDCIATYTSCISNGKTHGEGVTAVVRMLGKIEPAHFSTWTKEFKSAIIPVKLAVVSAVWSILVSKDVSSTGKFLKPHCIQILCILRLLSVDEPEGMYNHLAEVLTGQGKSVILGLLSAVLALTGHSVSVLCYSAYLSIRDQNDFKEFFKTFNVDRNVDYGTFDDLADKILCPISNNRQSTLRQMVKDRVLTHSSWSKVDCVPAVSKESVLLIDEVDVFFSNTFYGSAHHPCTFIEFEGVGYVQIAIWDFAQYNYPHEQMVELAIKYMKDLVALKDQSVDELNRFLNQAGQFKLLACDRRGNVAERGFSNWSFFRSELWKMVACAKRVRDPTDARARNGFSINDQGIICAKDDNGVYTDSVVSGYLNTFNYFRLKGAEYDRKGYKNYGYIPLTVGAIAYSLLPSEFQLILGVSGTLEMSDPHERSALAEYKINHFSILPTFFGDNHLRFDPVNDFFVCPKRVVWLKKIYQKTVEMVASQRAVLVFFESEDKMNFFSRDYKNKFDRLNVITENTSGTLRDTYINEAGQPGTVTLATKGMGRGVDYKSSLTVEKNGGVHVIQTFYSTDVKEELQIKGRTARKDNRGSYELILSRENLIDKRVINPGGQHKQHKYTYEELNGIRQQMSRAKGEDIKKHCYTSKRSHRRTLKYFGMA